ncbi:acetoacetate decarboxylase [Microbispora triticiradicis]|uniref:Acetoacetate decarboxylase n=3 Tax=Microbispora TaxID=2005 RepID=A0ABY3M3U3_9ACTN|nr:MULTISPECIES: acetoacetate decarboxylase family protein [Microbispora]RGA02932.1 acetoacetate decarboxylase [Microbispora triticiradicis]TLP62126.1 acetoacetate decarboxylase [Microbispora fusca]TYB66234.1 acetoacetate decarboxylase [Microbispora tritici]GLW21872.1 acetoacetate decarboxylase [Microbispora amethystogenes]
MASHVVQGRRVEMPVEVRDASMCLAGYLVRADAARAVLAYSGMDVTEVLPGKAMCMLAFVRYHDSDLGSYDEFGVMFLVRPAGASAPPRRGLLAGLKDLRGAGSGAFVHWLPVDQGFTMEAGRSIWGFPKELADVDLRLGSPYKRCVLRRDGRMVVDLLIRPGMPAAPAPLVGKSVAVPDAYTHLDGVTRRVSWAARARGIRWRPGGALVRLGNHPIAKELSELGLPRRALLTVTAEHVSMTFEEPRQA